MVLEVAEDGFNFAEATEQTYRALTSVSHWRSLASLRLNLASAFMNLTASCVH